MTSSNSQLPTSNSQFPTPKNTIHDQGYRRYQGRREPGGRRWWVIARAGLHERVRERRFLGLLLVAWGPFLVRAVQVYVASNYPQASFLAPTAETFREFLDQQSIFIFFVTIYVGAGLIANDRRANALQIYLSKPLTRVEYIGGKLATLMLFLLAVTWAPAVLLLVVQMMFAGDLSFFTSNLFLLPAITFFSLVQTGVAALTMLALSSLSNSRRFVSVMYAGIVFFTAALYQTLRSITGSGAWAWISPEDTFDVIADLVFGIVRREPMPAAMALLTVAVLMAVSLWVLHRRVSPIEIVT